MISLITRFMHAFNSILSHSRLFVEIEQELWLKEAALSIFPDTRDCSPSLVRFVMIGFKRNINSRI